VSHDVVVETTLHDEDVVELLSAADAVGWMGEAVDAHHVGELVAPPRVHTDLGDGRLVFTTGRLRGSWFGYRSYDSFGADPGAQMVVVHDEASGMLRAMAIGNELGPRRVGAIGGVAAAALAAPDAHVVVLIGTGPQAYTQMWALAAVRDIGEVQTGLGVLGWGRRHSRPPSSPTGGHGHPAPAVSPEAGGRP
jgi:ornithine cyclodeaminase